MNARHALALAVGVAAAAVGCEPTPDAPAELPAAAANGSGAPAERPDEVGGAAIPSPRLDFEALLAGVDGAVGKRFQSMQMEGMESATYRYDGPVRAVLDIVAPVAEASGFAENTADFAHEMGDAERELQEKMGMDMKSIEQTTYAHPDGDLLTVARTTIAMPASDEELTLLSIQLMNPRNMPDFGATMKPGATETPEE